MVILKVAGATLLELVAEAVFLGVLFGLLVAPDNLNAVAVAALPVLLVLFLNGYYITRPLLGLLWRGSRVGLYGALAAALFTIHMGIGYARLRADLTQVRLWVVITFFVAGATIVFVFAFCSRRWLQDKAERR